MTRFGSGDLRHDDMSGCGTTFQLNLGHRVSYQTFADLRKNTRLSDIDGLKAGSQPGTRANKLTEGEL
jgi:hypothetical protein